MKKTIILSVGFFLTIIFNYASARTNTDPLPTIIPNHITTLVINADVSVMLVNSETATLQMAGKSSLTQMVTCEKTGDTLVISSSKKRDLKGRVVIYVPASKLNKVQINSKADVRSLYPLNTPKLDLVINGVCEFAISNFGEVNLIGNDSYSIEQTTELRNHPADIFSDKIGADQVFHSKKLQGAKLN